MSSSRQYRVHEGVAWVNGARVPDDRKVRLTAAEARFDIEQGRISPLAETIRSAKPVKTQDAAEDGRD